MITGACESVIVTVKLHDAVNPPASVTVNVFVVVPVGNVDPLGSPAVCTVTAKGQLSVPIGATYITSAPHTPGVFDCVMFPGQVITGACESVIVTVNEHDAVSPPASVTVNVFVVVPVGKIDPLGRPAVCTVTAKGQLSVPTGAVYVTTAPQIPASFACVILPGHVITGASASVTVTLNEHTAIESPCVCYRKSIDRCACREYRSAWKSCCCIVVAP